MLAYQPASGLRLIAVLGMAEVQRQVGNMPIHLVSPMRLQGVLWKQMSDTDTVDPELPRRHDILRAAGENETLPGKGFKRQRLQAAARRCLHRTRSARALAERVRSLSYAQRHSAAPPLVS